MKTEQGLSDNFAARAAAQPTTGASSWRPDSEPTVPLAQDEPTPARRAIESLFANMLEGYARCQMIFDQDRLWIFVYLEVNGRFQTIDRLGQRHRDESL